MLSVKAKKIERKKRKKKGKEKWKQEPKDEVMVVVFQRAFLDSRGQVTEASFRGQINSDVHLFSN